MKRLAIFPLLGLVLVLAACGSGTPVPTDVSVPAAGVATGDQAVIPTTDTSTLPTDTPPAGTGRVPPPVSSSLDGAELLQERCSVCHSIDRATSKKLTADEWNTLVIRMIGKGAELNPQEQQLLVDYLAQNFHP